MRMPPLNLSIGLLLVRSYFLLARLNSNAKARTLMALMQPLHNALESGRDAKIKAENAVLFARGPVIEVNGAVALFLTPFQLDVLKVVAKNYDDPLYKALFPKGLTELRKANGQAMCEELVRIQTRLTELGKAHALAVHLPKIAELIKDYAAPLKTLKAAADALTATDVALGKVKVDWRLQYDTTAGALRQMFPGRKAYQDSFFMAEENRAPKKPAANGTQGVAPATEPATVAVQAG